MVSGPIRITIPADATAIAPTALHTMDIVMVVGIMVMVTSTGVNAEEMAELPDGPIGTDLTKRRIYNG